MLNGIATLKQVQKYGLNQCKRGKVDSPIGSTRDGFSTPSQTFDAVILINYWCAADSDFLFFCCVGRHPISWNQGWASPDVSILSV